MIIDCIGCFHGVYPTLEGGDLLIVTGDLTFSHRFREFYDFAKWMKEQKYEKKIVICGNHDTVIEKNGWHEIPIEFDYLQDSGSEFKGFKIWGSPWTARFKDINPHCCAFTGGDDEEIAPRFHMIPSDIDILITHGPPFTIRDKTTDGFQVGSESLMSIHIERLRPKLWVFSHIHEGYGQDGPHPWSGTRYVNCSIMNERYHPINKPIRIEL